MCNVVFVPMIAYGMESAALTTADLHRLEGGLPLTVTAQDPADQSHFLYQSLTDNPHAQTSRNEGVRTVEVVWSCFESNSEQAGTDLCFYGGFCL